jgi:membrane-associated phospholipid phosphatase
MRSSPKLALFAAIGCGVAFVALLGCAYTVGPVERLDATALHGLGTIEGPWTDRLAHLAAHLADPLPIMVMLGGLVAWGWAIGRRREAIAAVALVAGANVATQILKVALAHPRIQPALGPYQLGPEAFPSGHATAAMSIGLAAVLVAPARWRVVVSSVATGYVAAVATSVLVLAWHYPSDVGGGILVASACFFCAVAVVRYLSEREPQVETRRARLSVPPRLGEVALVGALGLAVLGLLRAQDLASFARLHTTATATALAIVATSAALLAGAALITDDQP